MTPLNTDNDPPCTGFRHDADMVGLVLAQLGQLEADLGQVQLLARCTRATFSFSDFGW